MQKMGWFGAVRRQSRSRAMPPFDRPHTTSYSILIETMCLSLQMEKGDKESTLIRMGVSGWMFLLVPAYPGCPGSKAVKRSLLLLYVSIFYRFPDIPGYLSKVADFDPPHLHLAPPEGAIPVEFCGDLWHQKTRVPGLSCGVVCVILRLAVLVEHRLVTDWQTQGHG